MAVLETLNNTEKLNPAPLDRVAQDEASAGTFAKSAMDQIGNSIGRGVGEFGAALQFHAAQAQKAKDTQALLDLATFSMNQTLQSGASLDKLVASNPSDPTAAGTAFNQDNMDKWTAYIDQLKSSGASPEIILRATEAMGSHINEVARTTRAEMANLSVAQMHGKVSSVMDGGTLAMGNNPFDTQANAGVRAGVNAAITDAYGPNPSAHMIIKADGTTEHNDVTLTRAQFEGALTGPKADPVRFQTALLNGDYDKLPGMSEALKAQFITRAQEAVARMGTINDKQNKDNFNAGLINVYSLIHHDAQGNVSVDPTFDAELAKVEAMPGAVPADLITARNYEHAAQDAINGVGAQTNDAATVKDFNTRLYHGLTEQEVHEAAGNKKLTIGPNGDGYYLSAIAARDKQKATDPAVKEANDAQYKMAEGTWNADTLPNSSVTIDPATGKPISEGTDVLGATAADQRVANESKQWLSRMFTQGMNLLTSQGKTDAEARDLLIGNPSSPYYLLHRPGDAGANKQYMFDPTQVDMGKQILTFPGGQQGAAAPAQPQAIPQSTVHSIFTGQHSSIEPGDPSHNRAGTPIPEYG